MSDDGVVTWIRKEIIEYGWNEDDCDVVFDIKKIEIIIILRFVSIIIHTDFALKCSILN